MTGKSNHQICQKFCTPCQINADQIGQHRHWLWPWHFWAVYLCPANKWSNTIAFWFTNIWSEQYYLSPWKEEPLFFLLPLSSPIPRKTISCSPPYAASSMFFSYQLWCSVHWSAQPVSMSSGRTSDSFPHPLSNYNLPFVWLWFRIYQQIYWIHLFLGIYK